MSLPYLLTVLKAGMFYHDTPCVTSALTLFTSSNSSPFLHCNSSVMKILNHITLNGHASLLNQTMTVFSGHKFIHYSYLIANVVPDVFAWVISHFP